MGIEEDARSVEGQVGDVVKRAKQTQAKAENATRRMRYFVFLVASFSLGVLSTITYHSQTKWEKDTWYFYRLSLKNPPKMMGFFPDGMKIPNHASCGIKLGVKICHYGNIMAVSPVPYELLGNSDRDTRVILVPKDGDGSSSSRSRM
ncbi:MAG: hypothetical protein OXU73_01990 [Candidatus Campbellbacteria bacterium]|nr:hypothetical protein [Candidatus Campbellbacteria bacterium]